MATLLLQRTVDQLANAGIEQPRLEAQLLLAHLLNVSRAVVIAGAHPPLSPAQATEFDRLIRKRVRRVPYAYLRQLQEFYGLSFHVGTGVLIPRPETELLVDFVIEEQRRDPGPLQFADVGTGTGCIAIAILVNCPEARAVAFDLSAEALTWARRNAARNVVADRLRFVRGDFLAAATAERYDLIVSNPPYIASSELATLQPEVRDYEPRLALDGGPDGLDAYRALAVQARWALKPGGKLAVEVGQRQAPQVTALMQAAGLQAIGSRRDLAGNQRIVIATNQAI